MKRVIRLSECQMREAIVNSIRKVLMEKVSDNGHYEEWCDEFMGYANEMVSELQSDYMNGLGLRIVLNTGYNFGRKRWLAVYEQSSGKLSQGIISIGVNLPLIYRTMKRKGIVDDEFNIEAQARISIGHEVGHGIVDYLTDYYDGDSEAVQEFLNGYWNGAYDEEELVEEFGEWCFPDATGVYSSVLGDLLEEIV